MQVVQKADERPVQCMPRNVPGRAASIALDWDFTERRFASLEFVRMDELLERYFSALRSACRRLGKREPDGRVQARSRLVVVKLLLCRHNFGTRIA